MPFYILTFDLWKRESISSKKRRLYKNNEEDLVTNSKFICNSEKKEIDVRDKVDWLSGPKYNGEQVRP